MGLVRGRFASASGQGGGFEPAIAAAGAAAQAPTGGPVAREFHAMAAAAPLPQRTSMANRLREAFALGQGNDAAVPAHVRSTYGRFSALGL